MCLLSLVKVPVVEKFCSSSGQRSYRGGLEYSISEELGYKVANFIISCSGLIAVVFNLCSKSTQDRLFGLKLWGGECRCYVHLHYIDQDSGGHLLQCESCCAGQVGVRMGPYPRRARVCGLFL